tara:strand:+ start:42511 stop:42924 length:414 start_codon:yes stop_codon:yes gene_type:complete
MAYDYETQVLDMALPQGSVFDVLVRTEMSCRLRAVVMANKSVETYIFEGCTSSNDGASLEIVARRRLGIHASASRIFAAPTLIATGTQMHRSVLLNGERNLGEWTLAPGQTYLFRLAHSIDAGNVIVGMSLEFSEPA